MSGLAYVMVPAHLARGEDLQQAQAMGRITKELIEHSALYELPHMVGRHGTMWRVLRDGTNTSFDGGMDGWVRNAELGRGVGRRPGQTAGARRAMVRRYLTELVVAGLAERRHGWSRATLPGYAPLWVEDENEQICAQKKAQKTVGDAEYTEGLADRSSSPSAGAAGRAVRERTAKQKARDKALARARNGRFVATSAVAQASQPSLSRAEDPQVVAATEKAVFRSDTLTTPNTSKLGEILTWDGDRPLTSSHPVSGAVIRLANVDEQVSAEDLNVLNLEFGAQLTSQSLPKGLITYADIFCAACVARDFQHPENALTSQILAVLRASGVKQGRYEDTDDPEREGSKATQHSASQRIVASDAISSFGDASARDRSRLAP